MNVPAMSQPRTLEGSSSQEPERQGDVESGQGDPQTPVAPTVSSVLVQVNEFEDNTNVPQLSYFAIFWFFLTKFGIFAWGGPVAQIALIKDQLVIQRKWITMARFNRVFAVYQILPGPEATELCMFFGCLAGGRIGGILAGLAFILPGFILMVLASYLYVKVDIENRYIDASFRALKPVVAAMVGCHLTMHFRHGTPFFIPRYSVLCIKLRIMPLYHIKRRR
jgi:chromate transport protein ChrA